MTLDAFLQHHLDAHYLGKKVLTTSLLAPYPEVPFVVRVVEVGDDWGGD